MEVLIIIKCDFTVTKQAVCCSPATLKALNVQGFFSLNCVITAFKHEPDEADSLHHVCWSDLNLFAFTSASICTAGCTHM